MLFLHFSGWRMDTSKKLKIVIFEDDPALAALLKQELLHKGHDVSTFSEPTACPVYRDHETQCPRDSPCADVIISDHMMPNMTGIDFLKFQRMRGCKALDENKALITGSVLDADLKAAIGELGCHYIKKPFKVAEILSWVDECAARVNGTESS